MSEPTKCAECGYIASGAVCTKCATPLPAPDPRDAIALMRVAGAIARRDARLPHPDYDKEAIDTAEVCWGDLRALLAAYQSVRSENEGLRDGSIVDRLREEVRALIPENRALREDKARLDWLEDHGGFETPDGKDGMSMARWGRSSDLTLRTAIDRARTGGTE
jgi:hypothetical protein